MRLQLEGDSPGEWADLETLADAGERTSGPAPEAFSRLTALAAQQGWALQAVWRSA